MRPNMFLHVFYSESHYAWFYIKQFSEANEEMAQLKQIGTPDMKRHHRLRYCIVNGRRGPGKSFGHAHV